MQFSILNHKNLSETDPVMVSKQWFGPLMVGWWHTWQNFSKVGGEIPRNSWSPAENSSLLLWGAPQMCSRKQHVQKKPAVTDDGVVFCSRTQNESVDICTPSVFTVSTWEFSWRSVASQTREESKSLPCPSLYFTSSKLQVVAERSKQVPSRSIHLSYIYAYYNTCLWGRGSDLVQNSWNEDLPKQKKSFFYEPRGKDCNIFLTSFITARTEFMSWLSFYRNETLRLINIFFIHKITLKCRKTVFIFISTYPKTKLSSLHTHHLWSVMLILWRCCMQSPLWGEWVGVWAP